MRNIHFITVFVLSFISSLVHAQDPQPGDWRLSYMHDGLNTLNDSITVQNGNGTLGSIFDTTLCGLNYTQSTVRLGQRFTPIGVSQPAIFAISGMPSCSPVVKAYFWCVTSGTGIPITANITNPDGTSASFLMTVVGQAGDLCWSSAGTYVYRADVTSIISGNGNYLISGLPTTTQLTQSNDDTDGATLLIMYQDLTSSFTGSIHLMDGAIGILGGTATQNMSGFNSCGNSTSGSAFMGAADLQIAGATYSMNGSASATYPTYNWMDFISQPTSVTSGQSNATYTLTSSGDCFCLFLGGLYWQTSCMTCNPSTAGLTITASNITPATCGPNGAATVAVTGGSGNYVITWPTNPTQYGTSAINLAGGTYVVSALDTVSGMCGNLVVTIPYTGPVLTTSSTPVNCQNGGTATVNVTGGAAPYTYSWSPNGGTGSTANNLSAGNYVVTVTDANSCTLTASVVVGVAATFSVSVAVVPDSCPGPSGIAASSASGGQPPYTYFWSPGNQITSVISNQSAGNYTLTVTDGTGCVVTTIVNIPANNNSTNVNVASIAPAYCGVGFMMYAAVNTSPVTFSWQPATYLSNPNSQAPMCIPYSAITYTVTATSACGTDTDTVSVSLSGLNLMDENICVVTVDTAINRNVIVWEHTNLSTGGYYNIYRETASAGVYAQIGTQHNSVYTTFTDMTSNPMNNAERYRISYVDSCGFESDTCALHRSIFLQVGPAVPGGYNLLWTAYEGLNIATYNIYRGPNAGNMSLIAQVPGTTFNYSDPNPPMGTILYLVEAVHPNGGCFPSLQIADPNFLSVPNSALSNLQVAFVGVEENNPVQSSLAVSPNPGNGIFVLNCNLASADDVNVTITDALGRVVFTNTQSGNGSTFRMEMDLSSLAAGVYNVQVTNGASKGVTKLVTAQ
jgi:hypothetical protein